jgi:hypothetical protein
MVVLLAVAAPVTTRVARHYSWSVIDKRSLQIMAVANAVVAEACAWHALDTRLLLDLFQV